MSRLYVSSTQNTTCRPSTEYSGISKYFTFTFTFIISIIFTFKGLFRSKLRYVKLELNRGFVGRSVVYNDQCSRYKNTGEWVRQNRRTAFNGDEMSINITVRRDAKYRSVKLQSHILL